MVSILDILKKLFFRRKPKEMAGTKLNLKSKKKVKRHEARKTKVKGKAIRKAAKLKKIKIKKIKKKFVRKKIRPKIKKLPKKPFVKKKKIRVPSEIIKEIIVGDIMTKNPIVVRTNDPLSYVMRLFADKKISGAPVLRNENFVGIISESDIVRMLSKKELLEGRPVGLKKLTEFKVEEFMHPHPVFVYEYTKLADALDVMSKHDITRLPILDDKRKIVGIVTRSDVVKGVARELLFKILKRKPIERVRLKIDTDIDEVLKIVERKGSINIDDVKKKLMIPEDKIEEWGKVLEEHGLIELFYPPIGKPKLRKKIK